MSFSEREISESLLRDFELENPALKPAAVMALQETLADALANTESLDAMWEVFRSEMVRRQYVHFTRELCQTTRSEVYARIVDKEYGLLRAEAVRRLLSDEHDSLRAEALSKIKEKLESDAQIAELRQSIQTRLETELRPVVEQSIRSDLMANPSFVEEVKAELKKRILGL